MVASLAEGRRLGAQRVLALAAEPRSGSTLLSSALASTGRAGFPDEYLRSWTILQMRRDHRVPRVTLRGAPAAVARRVLRSTNPRWGLVENLDAAALRSYARFLRQERVTANGVFAVKLQPFEYGKYRATPMDPSTWGLPITWVRLTREDRVRQAVSFVRAQQSAEWKSTHGPSDSSELVYDAERITRIIGRCGQYVSFWEQVLASVDEPVLTVTYEELAADYVGTVRSVLTILGESEVEVPPAVIRRQSDGLSDEWVARYRSEHGEG